MTPIFSLLSTTQRSALIHMHSIAEDGKVDKGSINAGEGWVTVTAATMRNLLGRGLATVTVGFPEQPHTIQITDAGRKECERNGHKAWTPPAPQPAYWPSTDTELLAEVSSVPEADDTAARLIGLLIEDAERRLQAAPQGSQERAYYMGLRKAYDTAADAFCGALGIPPQGTTEEAWMRASTANALDTCTNEPVRLTKNLNL